MLYLVFFTYVKIIKKEKETQNKIKKREKENRIKPSPSFTILTFLLFFTFLKNS